MPESTLIKFIICLIVLGFLWALSVLMVKIKAGMYKGFDKLGFKFGADHKYLSRLEIFALNNTHALHLMKLGSDRLILLAVSPNQIELILNTDIKQVNLAEPIAEQQNDLAKDEINNSELVNQFVSSEIVSSKSLNLEEISVKDKVKNQFASKDHSVFIGFVERMKNVFVTQQKAELGAKKD